MNLAALLERQRLAHRASPHPDFRQRRADLLSLKRLLIDHEQAICDAIAQDYGHRSFHETRLTELLPIHSGIAYTLRHLRQWMRVQSRGVDRISFGLARNLVIPQPVGVVGVLVPWNFPINLAFVPLTSIFAAGNRAMIKMSEHSRHLAQLLMRIVPNYFPPEKLCFIEETGGVGEAFSQLPFDHLLFTGSSQTGRLVMAAAARNLCPVTLELGGRSPAVVCGDFDLATAVDRIMYVKCLNAGQICVTVDHVYVPRDQVRAFVARAREVVAQRYGDLDSADYTSIIHPQAYQRLTRLLDQAAQSGAEVVPLLPGATRDDARHRLAPHVVTGLTPDAPLLAGEIFGPILPVLPYDDIQEVIATIASGPKPLAFYPFSHDQRLIDTLVDRVMSGGVSVNDALFHVAQHELPFGGVGASGMGHYHGREGFETFSKMRSVFIQGRWSMLHLLYPPYGKTLERMLRFLGR
ncbi:MAG: coniferyl aldehyde dehydrogenase [Burkholderiaceae bacterium]|nr:coniferyl aldehyde dehydrogenase [Burkholderiaceae bacterium]